MRYLLQRILGFISRLTSHLKSAVEGGILWILGGSLMTQFCGLLSSILVIRALPKAEYGFYISGHNFYLYFTIFVGLGLTNAVLQYCSEVRPSDNKNAIYRFSLSKGELFNVFLAFIIYLFSKLLSSRIGKEASVYMGLLSALPIFSYYQSYITIVLRVKRENIRFGILNIVYSILLLIAKLYLVRQFGVAGLVLADYLVSLLYCFIGSTMLQKLGFWRELRFHSAILSGNEKHSILHYALLCALTEFSFSLLVILDITCISLIMGDAEALADYKVATSLPSACVLFTSCLTTYYYPYMVEHYSIAPEDFGHYLKKLLPVFCLVGVSVSLILVILAPFLIYLIYGEKYLSSIPIMRVLCLNYMVTACFRKLFGNAIFAMKQVKINLIHTIIAGAVNIVLNSILIHSLGTLGAAIATTIITCFMSIMEVLFIWNHIRLLKR